MSELDPQSALEALASEIVLGEPGLPLFRSEALHGHLSALARWAQAGRRPLLAEAAKKLLSDLDSVEGAGAVRIAEVSSLLSAVVAAFQEALLAGKSDGEISLPPEFGARGARQDQKILSDFLARQDGVMEEFEGLVLAWEKHKSEADKQVLLRILHTVKGETALLGLADVEKLCHALEDYLGAVGEAAKPDLLLEARDWFLQAFRFRAGKGAAPSALEAMLAKLSLAAEPVAVPQESQPMVDAAMIQEFIVEASEHLDSANLNLLTLETKAGDDNAVNAVFRAFHTIKGVAACYGLEDIRVLSHQTENLLDLIRKGKIGGSSAVVDLLFESVDCLKGLVDRLKGGGNGGEDALAIKTLLLRLRSAAEGGPVTASPAEMPSPSASGPGKKLGEILVESGAISDSDVKDTLVLQERTEAAGAKINFGELLVVQGKASAREVTHALRSQKSADDRPAAPGAPERQALEIKETVKVEADRLDRLLDTIGELVIAESMIFQSPELRGKLSSVLTQRLAHLDKITRSLQEMGTSLRMVPIRPVFQKMARLVRDLGKKHGKAIEFTCTGEDTELDKTVVEKIGDPLVHMVRNAVDHGIEAAAEDRIRNGKPATARVRLKAFQKGGSICIELEDDGRGLDREAILAKARERGWVKDDSTLEDKEVWQFIFAPGFSTAKKITETSGRGVGMDVVKKNIEELRGRVEITSRKGHGTTFLIWLPLTMAIIDGMVVRVGGERVIFPTLSVKTIVPVKEEDTWTVTEKGRMLSLQGKLIPVFHLADYLGSGTANDAVGLAVISEIGGKATAFAVDELLGQQQIVIKNLGHALSGIPGVAGGAILSDGCVGIILDVEGLGREVRSRGDESAAAYLPGTAARAA
jgi:two-component system chemotaxis sensor kinase CheA